MKGLQASLHNIKLLQLKAALHPTESSKILSAQSIFLEWDPGNGWRDGKPLLVWVATCLLAWLLASASPSCVTVVQRTRPAVPSAGEGLGILLSRERMLLCLMFNAALAPGGCRQICLLNRLCYLGFLRVKSYIPMWKGFHRKGSSVRGCSEPTGPLRCAWLGSLLQLSNSTAQVWHNC